VASNGSPAKSCPQEGRTAISVKLLKAICSHLDSRRDEELREADIIIPANRRVYCLVVVLTIEGQASREFAAR
jgi:hypothetical protein